MKPSAHRAATPPRRARPRRGGSSRRHRSHLRVRRVAVVVAVLGVLGGLLAWQDRGGGTAPNLPRAGAQDVPTVAGASSTPAASGSSGSSGSGEPDGSGGGAAQFAGFPFTLPTSGGGGTVQSGAHTVVLEVQSDGPMSAVAWEVPSAGSPVQVQNGPSSPWSLTATGHGSGYLAALAVQGGPTSVNTICRITVDGKVTDQRVGNGAFAAVVCFG